MEKLVSHCVMPLDEADSLNPALCPAQAMTVYVEY
jgi:hypothetical protein